MRHQHIKTLTKHTPKTAQASVGKSCFELLAPFVGEQKADEKCSGIT